MIEIGLSEYRRVPCELYVFPADLFDIPGVDAFDNVTQIEDYAFHRLEKVEDKNWCVYVNNGLSIMLLSVILAAAKLGASLVLKHFDIVSNRYIDRDVKWKPAVSVAGSAEHSFTLCEARHYGLPEDVIFEEICNEHVMDFSWQECVAEEKLKSYAGKHIRVYITGLTQAFVSVLNVADRYRISITCMHYNYATESYFPQFMGVQE